VTRTRRRWRRFSHTNLLWCSLLLLAELAAAPAVRAQQNEAAFSQIPPLAADAAVAHLAQTVQPNTPPSADAQDGDREVSWKKLPLNILDDQKNLWLFPTQLARGHHWLPTIGVVGATAVFIATDPHDMPYFRRTTDFDEVTEVFSGKNTGALEGLVPASFYVVGLLRKDSYAQQTALLAGEAYVDSAIPHVVIKLLSRRSRPSTVALKGSFSDSFFHSHVTPFGKGSSFPSGHAAAAFSIATVIATRYSRHRWVPWLAYGLATAVSFSRVPALAHYPSDVFLGAALGYTITRFDVLRHKE
jgi:PAP2 superfamily